MATFQEAQVETSVVTSALALEKLRQEDLKFIARLLSHKKKLGVLVSIVLL